MNLDFLINLYNLKPRQKYFGNLLFQCRFDLPQVKGAYYICYNRLRIVYELQLQCLTICRTAQNLDFSKLGNIRKFPKLSGDTA